MFSNSKNRKKQNKKGRLPTLVGPALLVLAARLTRRAVGVFLSPRILYILNYKIKKGRASALTETDPSDACGGHDLPQPQKLYTSQTH